MPFKSDFFDRRWDARSLAADPATPGSMGIAASEAMEIAATHSDTHFAPGSVLNFTLMHHSVIGLEALEQMEMAGYWPDVLVACVGAGSNFAGFSTPFLGKSLREKRNLRVIAAEPDACPSLSRGRYAYDFIDSAKMSPVAQMYTLGSAFSRGACTREDCGFTGLRLWSAT